MDLYERNEVDADNKLKGKLLAVRGRVDKISKGLLGGSFVTLATGKQFAIFSVQCFFGAADDAALAQLAPGQEVVIAGTCGGKLGNVLLRDCWFYDESAALRQQAEQAAAVRRQQEEERERAAAERKAEQDRRAALLDEAKWRTWTSADGQRHFEGKFAKAIGETVHIEKHDGTVVKIPREKLSAGDWEWITKKGWLSGIQ